MRMRIEQDDVAVVTNIGQHLVELLLGRRLVVQTSMRRHRSNTKGMVDQGIAQSDSTVQDVNDGDASFGPLQRVAQSTGGIEVDCDDFETTSRRSGAQRIAAGCLSDTTF